MFLTEAHQHVDFALLTCWIANRLILCGNVELEELKFGKKLLSRIVVFHELYYFEVIIRLSFHERN